MTKPGDDIEVLNQAMQWQHSGRQVALATVLRTWGSSPRSPGSLMAMNDSGQYVGSVSGGCVEENLLTRFKDKQFSGSAPTLLDFGVDQQQAARMGLPCGGRLEVLVEPLNDPEAIDLLLSKLDAGELVARRVNLQSGETHLMPGNSCVDFEISANEVVKTFGPSWQLLIIGDGQLARHLASMALQLDYQVTICDPRDLYTHQSPLAGVQYSRKMPDDEVININNPVRTAIVTVAHDPRQDDLALSAAVESEAFYIGALGSRRSAQARLKRLQSLGYSHSQLERIHGPAGLYIGSKRPAEIAVSIIAQMTAIRNGLKNSQYGVDANA